MGQRLERLGLTQYTVTVLDRTLICNFCFSVAACTVVRADPSLRYTKHVAGTLSSPQTTTPSVERVPRAKLKVIAGTLAPLLKLLSAGLEEEEEERKKEKEKKKKLTPMARGARQKMESDNTDLDPYCNLN